MESPLFCDHCRSLYPAEGLNHFELLGFPPAFDIDPAALRQKYLQVSHGVHPDHHGDSADSTASLRLSAQLNEAHRVLADPVLRAEYLLELFGGPPASSDKSVLDGVLTNALMLREEIGDAQAAQDRAALAACATRVRQLHETTLARIGGLARQLPGDPEIRRQLRALLNSIKYYQKLLGEL
jgi:molecular chaperone HscB